MRFDRLNERLSAAFPTVPSFLLHASGGTGAAPGTGSLDDNYKLADRLLELARELDAIEQLRRSGDFGSNELVERCLSVWMEVRTIDLAMHRSGPPPLGSV